MFQSIYDKVISALRQSENHNSSVMVKPEVILWPDPEKQWEEVIPVLQEDLPQLLVYGSYNPDKKQGPAIWLKCMIAKTLPGANWGENSIPIIYLPGVSKNDLRNVEHAIFNFQPLLEYQYTGTLFMQENGREWTIQAFVENPVLGLGVKLAHDNATKDALKKTLPTIFQDKDVLSNKTIIDADYLNNQLFPDIIPTILKWMCTGDTCLQAMDAGKREVFSNLCKSQYDFEPDPKNIKAIAEKLGGQKNSWKYIWQHYANAPHKYPEVEGLLRLAKPADLGTGIFALPEESWPQCNEQMEEELAQGFAKAASLDAVKSLSLLIQLDKVHAIRRGWVWSEMGKAPLANVIQYIYKMATISMESFSWGTIEEIKTYYITKGFLVDQNMRKSMALVKTARDKGLIKDIITLFYKPWLEFITGRFQALVQKDATVFSEQKVIPETEAFVLFVDALRYELANEVYSKLKKDGFKVQIQTTWSAIPSLTATAKPAVSPIAMEISTESKISEFRPQLKNGADLSTPAFREVLSKAGYHYLGKLSDIQESGKFWHEIGNLDTRGHEEQSNLVKRIDEFVEQLTDAIDTIFEKGINRIKIVTDHGWLILPGGLPKTQLNVGLTETRWGRCALIKEGVMTDLLHLPWRWNSSVFIAYAPGINFFKANVEYAHGGISIHECLIPELYIENPKTHEIIAEIKSVKWVNLKCSIETTDVPDGYLMDIRTKYNDAKSSIVLSRSKAIQGNSVTLMVDDAAEMNAAIIVLMDENERILDKKPTSVGG